MYLKNKFKESRYVLRYSKKRRAIEGQSILLTTQPLGLITQIFNQVLISISEYLNTWTESDLAIFVRLLRIISSASKDN